MKQHMVRAGGAEPRKRPSMGKASARTARLAPRWGILVEAKGLTTPEACKEAVDLIL